MSARPRHPPRPPRRGSRQPHHWHSSSRLRTTSLTHPSAPRSAPPVRQTIRPSPALRRASSSSSSCSPSTRWRPARTSAPRPAPPTRCCRPSPSSRRRRTAPRGPTPSRRRPRCSSPPRSTARPATARARTRAPTPPSPPPPIPSTRSRPGADSARASIPSRFRATLLDTLYAAAWRRGRASRGQSRDRLLLDFGNFMYLTCIFTLLVLVALLRRRRFAVCTYFVHPSHMFFHVRDAKMPYISWRTTTRCIREIERSLGHGRESALDPLVQLFPNDPRCVIPHALLEDEVLDDRLGLAVARNVLAALCVHL